ncbi:MAG: hypothetical protein LHW50_07415 [Candidatus Cloacimonetes bacterium]|nr:hypothetical protein [Candidatus Cloacimonadota bacterium]MCK9517094.1 hypothetical protein [Ottowia sp.]
MAQKTAFPFGTFMPGFDFLNQLASAGSGRAAAPGLQHWIAPTVDTDELERRINELRTVQFWLEQNLLGIKASIQALEVQKMTLQTLEGMNLSMGEVAKAFTLPSGVPAPAGAKPAADREPRRQDEPERGKSKAEPQDQKDKPAATMADPLQWWGALSQQFQQIAADALQEAAQRTTSPAAGTDKAPAAKKTSQAAPKPAKKAAKKKAAGKTVRKDTPSAPAAHKSTTSKPKK